MNAKPIKKLVIAGGGTAGWMAAATFSKLMGKGLDITLVESDAIGTVGVGEATIPTLHNLHRILDINEKEFMAKTNATIKLGINFENWKAQQHEYFHSFGYLGRNSWATSFQHFWKKGVELGLASPEIGDYCPEHLGAREGRYAILNKQDLNYAYHLDATKYAQFLRQMAEEHGCTRIEGMIEQVNTCKETGNISELVLQSGQVIEGDFFIDCSGFKALLIEKTLHVGYHDWSDILPMDSAVAVQTQKLDNAPAFTRSIAHDAGWQWQIPLQTRTGNGIVFCSKYMTNEQAIDKLLSNINGEPINQPRVINFKTGTRKQHWHKNCVAIGLSSGFIEPLESTSIHLFQRSILRLVQLFPQAGLSQQSIDEFNSQTLEEIENVRDFVVLHYHLTQRDDSQFWQYCKGMQVPAGLKHRMQMFENTGHTFKKDIEIFGESSWVQVMLGQGLTPKTYHPAVDLMPEAELKKFLDNIAENAKSKVANWPSHLQFIAHYCPSNFD
ncbi:tryptophan halogenase family protein [Paraferrimonas sp. SM1919]|uniref:tryptophan halogenase family protein n=1 Tax=Paraferrimonas sp. SM1919 TaxID=2662263 RepID=UPI0013D81C7D|nr:tryptophan halogenase family protein [Paraferrimonas sp. SM1919]